jgi:ATP-dependent DNA ligase
MARRDGVGIRLTTRNGIDFANRFPIIVAAVTALPARSFLIDGEAIVTIFNHACKLGCEGIVSCG